jgi:hypothetical protein
MTPHTCLFLCLLAAPAFAQDGSAPPSTGQPLAPPAVYQTYGTGCPGSGGAHVGTVVPAAYANAMGNSNNYYPFGRSNMRYQQVFLGAEFGAPKVLQGFALRQTSTTTGRPGGQQTIEVLLGVTTLTHATLTSTYASNFDSGPATSVFKSSVNIPTLTGTNTDPTKFALTITFTRPWVYSATSGRSLLVEVVNTSTSDITQFWDAASGSNVTTTRLYAFTSTATTGTLGVNYGVIFCFLSPGAGAVPSLTSTGRPVLNTTFSVDLSKAKASTGAVLVFGVSKTLWGAIPLPWDLTMIGAPGCSLLSSVDLILAVATDASGNAKIPLSIPNSSSLNGLRWFNQYAVIDPVNALQLVFSNGGEAIVGDS